MGTNNPVEADARKTKILGQTAIHQLLHSKCEGKSQSELRDFAVKIESNLRRFDKAGKGSLTVDDFYNVIKVQNGVDCTKNDIRKLVADLDMDKHYKIKIKVSAVINFNKEFFLKYYFLLST